MVAFQVNDMTCGHCAGAITKAVKALDQNARVDVDLGAHQVRIEQASTDADTLRRAIQDAGYSPLPL